MGSYIEEFQNGRKKKSDIIVTVDGKSAAGKGTLADFIAEKLGVKHFSASDVFYQIADERGIEDHELSEEAEKEVDLAVDRKTLERALDQDCVIDSRIASWVLGDHANLKIKLVADLEERARRLADREEISQEKAEQIVRKRDSEDSRRYKEYYGIDLDNEEIYDVVIDNTDLGIEEQNLRMQEILEQRFPEQVEE